jgi:hypothetical protein
MKECALEGIHASAANVKSRDDELAVEVSGARDVADLLGEAVLQA